MNNELNVNEFGQGHSMKIDLPNEVIDVKAIDWNRVWRDQLALRKSLKRDACFWDGRASSFAKATETEYIDHFLAIMKPEAHWTVFDMGCGSGTLAVPLAKLVSSVTAVDFSREMLNVVRKRCENENIHNVKIVHGQWEDDWEKLGINICDVAIASRSMVVDDLQSSILKLSSMARKRVYIVTVAGDGPRDRRLFEAVGRPFDSGPDYIYNYNLLYRMGIPANVAFIEEIRNRKYESPEEAVESMKWMFDDLNSRESEKLTAYVQKHLIFNGGAWRLSYANIVRWAVMWWEKD
ncbi:MAG: methyltransferase domain-containing protein [Smithella sp.]